MVMGRSPVYSEGLFPTIVGYRDEEISVVECSSQEADEVISKNHYSRKPTPNRFVSLSINGGLGYIQLGYGIRPGKKESISKAISKDNYCEFDRMWLDDVLPKNSESKAIGLLLAYIRAAHKRIKFVITYADESAGNVGTIYKATNAIPCGSIPCDFYILASGERVHPVTMWHRHKTRAWETMQRLYPGIRHTRGEFRQNRFVYPMDRYSRRSLEKA